MYDSEPSKIQAASLDRDGGWNWTTDALGIIFDTFNDNENAIVFVTTPAGTRTDVNILNDVKTPATDINTKFFAGL